MSAERYWTDTRIVEAVAAFFLREGRWPRQKDFDRTQGLPACTVVRFNMGTWQEPVRRARAQVEGGEIGCP